jgi:uncharacterized protein (TIGR02145 family)
LYGSGGTLTNDSTPNATFTGVAGTIYTLRYTVSNGCGSTSDDMNVSFSLGGGSGCSPQPSQANAGPDASNLCGVATLNANAPTVGTGQWSKISGSGGSFANASSASTTFTGTAGQTYVLRWTIANACGSTADELTLVFVGAPTTANAGLDQTNVTTQFATLNGNAPTVGSGQWSIVAGVGGSLSGGTQNNSLFTGLSGNSYVLKWTITNACGVKDSDEVIIAFDSLGGSSCPPTSRANAGRDSAFFCFGGTLYADSVINGTGTWSVISGTTFYVERPNVHNSRFYGNRNNTYRLVWTVNGICGTSKDTVQITILDTASVRIANAGLTSVELNGDTTYVLSANAPLTGSVGTWTVISGYIGSFSNVNSPTAIYYSKNNVTSTLRWTFSNSCGIINSDTIQIIVRLTSGCVSKDTVLDSRDGQKYPTVSIGTQCWMAKNMNVGVQMPSMFNQLNNGIVEKYCFDDQGNNCSIYGGLYQWAEAVQYQNGATNVSSPNPSFSGYIQGICPAGWHFPSDLEWNVLETFLGGYGVAGGKMKLISNLWRSPNTGANNISGFSALPGGFNNSSQFSNLGYSSNFWSSNDFSSTLAFFRNLSSENSSFDWNIYDKARGLSVRCLKD